MDNSNFMVIIQIYISVLGLQEEKQICYFRIENVSSHNRDKQGRSAGKLSLLVGVLIKFLCQIKIM